MDTLSGEGNQSKCFAIQVDRNLLQKREYVLLEKHILSFCFLEDFVKGIGIQKRNITEVVYPV